MAPEKPLPVCGKTYHNLIRGTCIPGRVRSTMPHTAFCRTRKAFRKLRMVGLFFSVRINPCRFRTGLYEDSQMDQSELARRDRMWFITQRWQEYEAEGRANLLRIIGVGSFYTIHLIHYYTARGTLPWLGFLQLGEGGVVTREFHVSVTLLAVAWTMLAAGVLLCLQRRLFPAWLKFLSTGSDIFLLTAVLYLADGPRSPLVIGYFLILTLSSLRLSLPLVRFATVGCALGYLCLLGCAKWPITFGKGDVDLSVPRYHQLIVLVALLLAGVFLGQISRRARRVAEDFADRSAHLRDNPS